MACSWEAKRSCVVEAISIILKLMSAHSREEAIEKFKVLAEAVPWRNMQRWKRKTNRVCHVCAIRCTTKCGCMGVRYCSSECQKKVWESHKEQCKLDRKKRAELESKGQCCGRHR